MQHKEKTSKTKLFWRPNFRDVKRAIYLKKIFLKKIYIVNNSVIIYYNNFGRN